MAGGTLAAMVCEDAEAHADAAERALVLCLQQPAFHQPDDRVAITLLRVSQRLAALVTACRGGTLVLRARASEAAASTSLAAWLSRHGALLADLTLYVPLRMWQAAAAGPQQQQQQHPAQRMLAQLPGSLTRLVFDSYGPDGGGADQAAALAAAFGRQPMQLRHLALPRHLRDQAATLLPALRQLSQLTSLVVWMPHNPVQLPAQHLPAQLQQLELASTKRQQRALSGLPWAALPHLTGLTSLSAPGVRVDGGALPDGLRALTVADISTAVPLQRLAQLTALQLTQCTASAEQLRQLSALQHLEQLTVTISRNAQRHTLISAAPAFGALPLVHLDARELEVTAACLYHLGTCTRMTQLQLGRCRLAPGATLKHLAAMLHHLTALERYGNLFHPDMEPQSAASDAAWAAVCKALARLPRLAVCKLTSALGLGAVSAAQLAAATQLTELHLGFCGLDDASILALCSGLTGLRRLDVSDNDLLGDGCLEGFAALRQLSWLRMRDTNVTETGLQQLRVARPELRLQAAQPELQGCDDGDS